MRLFLLDVRLVNKVLCLRLGFLDVETWQMSFEKKLGSADQLESAVECDSDLETSGSTNFVRRLSFQES